MKTLVFGLFKGGVRQKRKRPRDCAQWWRDPLSHPDLQKMSLDQLADLPFDPAAIKDEAE